MSRLSFTKRALAWMRRIATGLQGSLAIVLAVHWLVWLNEEASPYGRIDFSSSGIVVAFESSSLSFRLGNNTGSESTAELWTATQYNPDGVDTLLVELQRRVPGTGQRRYWIFPGQPGGASVFTPPQGRIRTWFRDRSGFQITYSLDRFTPEMDNQQFRMVIPCWFAVCALASYPSLVFFRGPLRRFRRRKAGRCWKCGYNLTGSTNIRCPECSTPHDLRP